tara:strand:+ start:2854 stop:3147 length:294 start_codon:yes stop_codon:yes gene_type:complete
MAVLINAKLKLNKLDQSRIFKGKVHNFYDVTISLNDDTKFENNVSIWSRQTQAERESKLERQFVGEGQVIWMDDSGASLVQKENEPQTQEDNLDLPF